MALIGFLMILTVRVSEALMTRVPDALTMMVSEVLMTRLRMVLTTRVPEALTTSSVWC